MASEKEELCGEYLIDYYVLSHIIIIKYLKKQFKKKYPEKNMCMYTIVYLCSTALRKPFLFPVKLTTCQCKVLRHLVMKHIIMTLIHETNT